MEERSEKVDRPFFLFGSQLSPSLLPLSLNMDEKHKRKIKKHEQKRNLCTELLNMRTEEEMRARLSTVLRLQLNTVGTELKLVGTARMGESALVTSIVREVLRRNSISVSPIFSTAKKGGRLEERSEG